MRLYRISGQSSREQRQWVGTQEEARKGSKERGGFFDLVDVPTDKSGLLEYLNKAEHERAAWAKAEAPQMTVEEIKHSNTPEAHKAWRDLQNRPPAPKPEDGAEALVDWLFDHASPSQVCDVFLGLSSRFREIVQEKRA